ncbi:MAG TPA: MFS transporter [Bacteroidota bacterium]|nr:MFS transporter [Bacteroidota bacterium]
MTAENATLAQRSPNWRSWVEPWFLSYALLGASVAGLAPIILPLSVGRTGTLADIGLVMGAFNLGGLSAPLWGGIADRRHSHRSLLVLGLAAAGIALAAFPFVSALGERLVLAFVQGAGAACAATVANLFVVEIHPRSEWDERIGWLQTFYGGGQVVGLLLAGFVSGIDMYLGFLIASGITMIACLPGLSMKGTIVSAHPSRPTLAYPSRHAELNAGSPQSFYHHLNAKTLEHLVRSIVSPLGIFLVAWLISFGGVAAFFSLYPVLMKHQFGVDPSLSSIGFAVAATAGLFLYAPAGTWSRKFGPLPVFRAALAVRALAFLVLVVIGAFSFPLGGPLAVIGFAFVVLAWSLLSVTGTEITAQFSEAHEGEGLGLFNASTGVAGVLGAVIGGWVAGTWGYETVSVLGIGGAVIGILLTAAIKNFFGKPEEKEKR